MAEIDVSDVVTDPDFQDTFTLIRSVETVDQHGRGSLAATTMTLSGVVQAASGRTMELTPDAVRTSEMLEIWTTFGIQEATQTTQADQVVWKGTTFIVTHVDVWDNWGQGYRHAVLTRKDMLPVSS
jgi:hypothetical protein